MQSERDDETRGIINIGKEASVTKPWSKLLIENCFRRTRNKKTWNFFKKAT